MATTLLGTSDLPEKYWKSTRMIGETPFFACQADPRISYCMYVPPPHYSLVPSSKKLPLVVNVHGSLRRAERCRDDMVDLADREGAAILAPLFPAGLEGPNDMHGYKLVRGSKDKTATRYDEILLEILGEVATRWPGIDTSKFFLCGFSGGGQFALRFAYLHPDRLEAVSVGAPGTIVHPDCSMPWPFGLEDIADYLDDEPVDMKAIATLAIQLVVGEEDVDKNFAQGYDMLVGSRSGDSSSYLQNLPNRLEALETLHKEMSYAEVHSMFVKVPDAAHESRKVLPAMLKWLMPLVQARNARKDA